MSLKAIELQIALPRTQSAGKIQDQLQQRGQVVQDYLATEQQKKVERERKQVIETSETEKKRLNNDDENRDQQNSKKNQAQKTIVKQNKQISHLAKHPYKGNYVDFSG